jgi:hypothetical protein
MYKFHNMFFPASFPHIEFAETRNVHHIMCLLIFWIIQTALLFQFCFLVYPLLWIAGTEGSIHSLFLDTNYDISGNTSQVSQVLPVT